MTDNDRAEHIDRRSVLKTSAALAGISTVGGLSSGAVARETMPADDNASDIDPVFGLPLAVGQAVPDGIDPAHVVELDMVEKKKENIHEGFPQRPDPENPKQMIEAKKEFLFEPVGVRVAPGDVVHFKSVAHLHTVTAFHQKWGEAEEFLKIPTRIPDGTPGFHSPLLMKDASWLYKFSEPGVYDLFCLPHVSFGMVQRVVVTDSETDAATLTAPSGKTFPNAMAVLAAPEFEPQHIVEAGTVGWRDLTLQQKPEETTTTTG